MEALLEPAHRPTSATSTDASSLTKRRHETIESRADKVSRNSEPETDPAIASSVSTRLRVRLSGGIKYDGEEEEEEELEDGVDEHLDKFNNDEFNDDDFDSCDDETDVYEEDFGEEEDDEDIGGDGEGDEEEEEEEELQEEIMPILKSKRSKSKPQPIRGRKTRSSHLSSDDDDSWTPKLRVTQPRSKSSRRAPIKLKVKIKEEPMTFEEKDVFDADTEDDVATNLVGDLLVEIQPKKKRSHHKKRKKGGEMTGKEPRSHHKKMSLREPVTRRKYRPRRIRSADSPKWEKKVYAKLY